MIGIVRGMGPAATLDFLAKLVRLTTAGRDRDHVPAVVVSDARISDRGVPIEKGHACIAWHQEHGRGTGDLPGSTEN